MACIKKKSYINDTKSSSIAKYDDTLFPHQEAYDAWKEKANTWDFKISHDCEIWFEKGLIEKGGDIADYYINLATLLCAKYVKFDYDWNQEEYGAFKIVSSTD